MKVKLNGLTKQYGNTIAVNDLSIDLGDGELIALLGPSGCGKSTTLYMLAGITPVSKGQIFFDDQDITQEKPEKRGIGLVFQNYALYPHMTVLENICFPLEIQHVKKAERIERAKKIAAQVRIDQLLSRKPAELSGGQQQRVAIARALVKQPRLLLLDEPLSMILPFTSSIFYTYILKNFFDSIPDTLYQSAKVDGASDWFYLWHVLVPVAKPSLVTIILLDAISCWNSFFWPLLVTNTTEHRTLQVGLYSFMSEGGIHYEKLMAAATVVVLPMIILFIFLRKKIISGVASGGLKG